MYAYAREGDRHGCPPRGHDQVAETARHRREARRNSSWSCAAGTYARSLAHDIGRDYGCGAHLVQLRRTRSGEFPIDAAIQLGDGSNFQPREFFLAHVIPMRDLLPELPAIVLSGGDRGRVSHGMDLNLLTAADRGE